VTPAAFLTDKRPLSLGHRLGKGGEGEVYAIADQPGRAVKIYTGTNAADRREKIKAMIDAGLSKATTLVAFPIEVVEDKRGQFLGFIMAKVAEHKPIHELYAPGARKAEFPKANYPFLVRTAANVARAVAVVHRAGCVIGDINHSGILVSDKATVALIDADSFQIIKGAARYLCRVGVAEYTPPELQGRPLESIVRTPDHDAFGLAVVIFQLLWMGRHPFSGRFSAGDMPIEKAIRENRFVYSRRRQVGMTPPPGVPSLDDVPGEIAEAFENAFKGEGRRPTAEAWVAMLERLEKGLKVCSASSLHHYFGAAAKCPWCHMERTLNAQLFVPTFSAGATGFASAQGTSPAQLWRPIEALTWPAREPPLPTFSHKTFTPSSRAQEAKSETWMRRAAGVVFCLAGAGVLYEYAAFWPVWVGAFVVGVMLMAKSGAKAKAAIAGSTLEVAAFQTVLDQWYESCGLGPFETLFETLKTAKAELEKLPQDEQQRIADYTRNRRAEQLKDYLERFQLRKHKIKGIGPSKLAVLTSYGIEDALDVTYNRVIQVPGFGPATTSTLVEWRNRIEARFVYDPNTNNQDRARIAQIKADCVRAADERRKLLAQGPAVLKQAAEEIARRRSTHPADLQTLYEARCQAAADLQHLGQAVSAVGPSAAAVQKLKQHGFIPPPVRQASAPGQGTAKVSTLPSAPSCPRCSGRMTLRTARKGANAGRQFWGCRRYPSCTGTRPKS